jgi:hypothetical protein
MAGVDGEDERKGTAKDTSLALQLAATTGVGDCPWGPVGAKTDFGSNGSRCVGGVNSVQALVRNVITSLRLRREMGNG